MVAQDAVAPSQAKHFIWMRRTLPRVCSKWNELLRQTTCPVWRTLHVNVKREHLSATSKGAKRSEHLRASFKGAKHSLQHILHRGVEWGGGVSAMSTYGSQQGSQHPRAMIIPNSNVSKSQKRDDSLGMLYIKGSFINTPRPQ
eukprot:1160308-Pelagomonas_calceolata.AAC.1